MGSPLLAYIVLAVSFAAEGTSLARAVHQARQARSRRLSLVSHVRDSPDTTVKAALFEDCAAIIGLILASAGLVLWQLTGSAVWDGSASIAIGALLVVVAIRLGGGSDRQQARGPAAGDAARLPGSNPAPGDRLTPDAQDR